MLKKDFSRIKIVGGIGNQLFILFFGFAVSSQLRTKLLVDDKQVYFGSNKTRRMEVSKLEFSGIDVEYRRSILRLFVFFMKINLIRRILWNIFVPKQSISEKEINSKDFKFSSRQNYSGYFQDWFYADFLNETNFDLSLKLKSPSSQYLYLAKEMKNITPICVHVRLGDYLDFPDVYSILPEYYFLNSIEYLKIKNSQQIWLISENRDQVREFYPKLYKLSDKVIDKKFGLSDFENFLLLSNCSKLIASNSTYSMWAAWFVNKNKHQAIVPLQFGIKNHEAKLSDERWDRYDLEKKIIVPASANSFTYLAKKSEFLSKFNAISI